MKDDKIYEIQKKLYFWLIFMEIFLILSIFPVFCFLITLGFIALLFWIIPGTILILIYYFLDKSIKENGDRLNW